MILLSTSTLKGYGLHRILSYAKEAGFHGVDLSVDFDEFDTLDVEYLKKITKEIGVKILSISAPGKNMNESIVDKILALASQLDSQVVTFLPPHYSDKSISWYQKYLPKVKENSSISIAVQNVEPKFLFFIIPKRKHASLVEVKKITGDTSFDLSSSMDIINDITFLGASVKNIYLSDKMGEKTGLMIGTGIGGTSHLPIESFLMKLKANGYNGFFSLRIDPKEIGAGNEQTMMSNLKNCIAYYEKYFEKGE